MAFPVWAKCVHFTPVYYGIVHVGIEKLVDGVIQGKMDGTTEEDDTYSYQRACLHQKKGYFTPPCNNYSYVISK